MSNSLKTRRSVLGMAGAAGLTSAFPAAGQAPAARTGAGSRPNLILFFTDEMRADALGCYGNPVVKTPNIDALARQSARFENCHVQFPVCGASRCSLLTGWPASQRGHRSLYYFLRPDEPNLFRYLKEGGYDVFWLGKNDALAQETFYGSLTDWYEPPGGEGGGGGGGGRAGPPPTGPVTMLFPSVGDRRKTSDYDLVQRAIKLLERRETDRPFCIFLALVQPHPPYTAPADFASLYKPSDLPPLAPPGLPKKPGYQKAIRDAYGLSQVPDAQMREIRATYYAQVSYSDWLLGELLQAMERTGRNRDTALVFSSDHGDYAGDYGLVEKWPGALETCLTHVPLIARIPGGAEGVTDPNMVELYDIMATFLDLAGVQANHTHFARSLAPQIHGAPGDPNRAAFTEAGYNIYEPQAFEPPGEGGFLYRKKHDVQNDQPDTVLRCASVRTRQHTYIARPGGQSELYDRSKDPMETTNLIDDAAHHKIRDDLQTRLVNWYIDTTGVPPMDKDPRNAPPHPPSRLQPVSPEERARALDR